MINDYNPLKADKFDNVGLKENSTIDKFVSEHKIQHMQRAYNGIRKSHNTFTGTIKKLQEDTTLTKDAKGLVSGRSGQEAMNSLINHGKTLRAEVVNKLNNLDKSLYTNSVQIDPNQMMMVGLVGEQLKSEGLKYLDRAEYIHPIATMLARAGLLPYGQGEAVIEKLNNKHSSETLATIAEGERALKAVDMMIQNEEDIIRYATPAEDELRRLEASNALNEIKKLTAGV